MAYEARRTAETVEKSRGRYERRTLTTTTVGVDQFGWPGAAQAVRLERQTVIHGETRTTVQYAVTSASRERADAQTLLAGWRGRWGIENRVFWVRDVVFHEDRSRIRTGQAPHALSIIRNAAINLLRHAGVKNLTAALRHHALKLDALLARLNM